MEQQITAFGSGKDLSNYFDCFRKLINRFNELKEVEKQKLEHCSNLQQQLDQANKELKETQNNINTITDFLKAVEEKTQTITGQSTSNSSSNSKTGKKRSVTDGPNGKVTKKGRPRKQQKTQVSSSTSPSTPEATSAERKNSEEPVDRNSASSPEVSTPSKKSSRGSNSGNKRRVSFATPEATPVRFFPQTEDQILPQLSEAEHSHSIDNSSKPMTRRHLASAAKELSDHTSSNGTRRELRPRNRSARFRYREEEPGELEELEDDQDGNYSPDSSSDE